MKVAEARARVELVQQMLGDHPDVNAVGVGEKIRHNETQKHYAAVVFVENKGTPLGRPIPPVMQTDLGPIPKDVVEAPKQSFDVINSVLDGADILIDGADTRRGTLAFVSRSNGKLFGITNAHVVTGPGGNAVGQSVLAHLNGVRTRIGVVVGHSPFRPDILNRHDVALIQLDPNAEEFAAPYMTEAFPGRAISEIGRLSPAPQSASRRTYYYASKAQDVFNKVRLENVTELSGIFVNDTLSGTQLPFGRCYHLTATEGSIIKGHSGAALVRPTDAGELLVVGVLFAGGGRNAFALSWHDIAGALGEFGA